MKTAYYRNPSNQGSVALIDASSLSAAMAEQSHPVNLSLVRFICPVCGERVFFSKGNPENAIHSREPHFMHQNKALSNIQECDLRVEFDNNKYISQRVRTPLFLRRLPNGSFVLSAGFHCADKALLQTLKNQAFTALEVHNGSTTDGTILLKDMLAKNNTVFIDLDAPVPNQSVHSVTGVSSHMNRPASKWSQAWSDTLDWFADTSCTGAVFNYETDNLGEKIQTGFPIVSGRMYYLISKDTGNAIGVETIFDKLKKADKMIMKQLGVLNFKTKTCYLVYAVKFPFREQLTDQEYDQLTTLLEEHYGVLLSDTLCETRPVWPPAARQCDAYTIAPSTDKSVYLAVDGDNETLYAHRSKTNILNLTVIRKKHQSYTKMSLVTTRTPVTFHPTLPAYMHSYRLHIPEKPIEPSIRLVDKDAEQVITRSGDILLQTDTLTITPSHDGWLLLQNKTIPLQAGCKVSIPFTKPCALVLKPGFWAVITPKIRETGKPGHKYDSIKRSDKYGKEYASNHALCR